MILSKEIYRKDCLKKIKELPLHNKIYRNALVNKELYKQLKNVKNKTILFYYPLWFEADVRKTMLKLRCRNTIYLPFMEGQSFKMVKYRLPLVKKKFDIFEAGNSIRNIKTIDIAIVPALGVDDNLQRIGFGKGMYDRFFAKLRKKPYTIFIQIDKCHTKEKICDSYDISCDLLVSPREITVAR